MLANTIRYSLILISSCYIFLKLLNISSFSNYQKIKMALISFITSLCASFLFSDVAPLHLLFIMFWFNLSIKLITKLPLSVVYTTTIFSFSLSYIALNFASIVLSLILAPFYYGKYDLPLIPVLVVNGIIQIAFILYFFHVPRIRKGMTFLYHIPSGNIGSALCMFLIILLITFYSTASYYRALLWIFPISILLLGFVLVYWWNFHLTQTYRKYLKTSELNSLHQTIDKKNLELEHLKAEYDKLSRIIHKDNKLIPALATAVDGFLDNQTKLPPLDLSQYGQTLRLQLNELYDERFEALEQYQQRSFPLPTTGICSLDAILQFMQQKAASHNIRFQLSLSENYSHLISHIISEKDCVHLLSDLIENAIIATKGSPIRTIEIEFSYSNSVYAIRVYDTGAPFPIETLRDFGLKQNTTHSDTGGSGIGLMDIWSIKEKYKATLLIDEVCSKPDKQHTGISILFNEKNHFIIHSDRYNELVENINRFDLKMIERD